MTPTNYLPAMLRKALQAGKYITNLQMLNAEFFRVVGILTLVLYILETLKEGYVSFFVNPVWFLALFVLSGVIWLFSPDKVEK